MSVKNRQRTYARNRAFSRRGHEKIFEPDGVYFLKLVGVILLGTLWLKFAAPLMLGGIPITGLPIGLVVGLILIAKLEKYQQNRKILYAILLMSTVISYFLPAGIVL